MKMIGMDWMRTVLREPLLHFVVLGGLLFAVFGGGEDQPTPDEIVISAGQIRNLTAVFERTWKRAPTAAELEGLIQDRIDEEVLAREARLLRLDENDTVIRRRLRQKMEFIAQDLAPPRPASEADLQAYLEANPDRFTVPARLTFTQVFLAQERRGEELEADARKLLARLNGGAVADPWALGDSSLLDAHYADMTVHDVGRLFGGGFAERLATLPTGRWVGPVPSPYGLHLVRIETRSPPALPPLDEIRAEVAREVAAERAGHARDALIDGLRERYQVVVERPGADLAMAEEPDEAGR